MSPREIDDAACGFLISGRPERGAFAKVRTPPGSRFGWGRVGPGLAPAVPEWVISGAVLQRRCQGRPPPDAGGDWKISRAHKAFQANFPIETSDSPDRHRRDRTVDGRILRTPESDTSQACTKWWQAKANQQVSKYSAPSSSTVKKREFSIYRGRWAIASVVCGVSV